MFCSVLICVTGAHEIITLQIEFIKCLLVWAFCCCSSRFDLNVLLDLAKFKSVVSTI